MHRGEVIAISPLLTTAQVAALLGVSQQRVRALCRQGRLGSKVGRDWVIDAAQLVAFNERRPGWPRGKKRGADLPSGESKSPQ